MDPSDIPSFSGTWEKDLVKQLIEEEVRKIGKTIELGPEKVSEILDQAASEDAVSLYETLKKKAPGMITYEIERREAFATDNYSKWKEAFDLIEMQLKISCEIIGNFIAEVGPLINSEEKNLFDAISALHGNGCFVAKEIFVLMRAGYASGALARWRKLYEIEVTALYLEQYGRGSGNELAKRYWDYSVIDTYRKVKLYAEEPKVYEAHSKKLGFEPYPGKDIQILKDRYNEQKEKYDSKYCKRYGWTFIKAKGEIPFNSLARAVNLGHLYPYYQLANDAVHSSPGNLFWNISLPTRSQDTILIGPTYYGMADPGQLLARSMNRLNYALLSLHSSLIAKEILIINDRLTEEILEALMKAHNIVDAIDVSAFRGERII